MLSHFQQAAEKAMKGFLTWHDAAFTRTHDLRRLVDACFAIDGLLENPLARAAPLFEPSIEEAQEALKVARIVAFATAQRIGLLMSRPGIKSRGEDSKKVAGSGASRRLPVPSGPRLSPMDLGEIEKADKSLQIFFCAVDSMTTPVMRRPGKGKRAVATPLMPIKDVHEFVHNLVYPKAVEKSIRDRSTPEKAVTQEEALRELHIALSQTNTGDGRQWWYRWCARYYRAYMDQAE